jgi:DNA-binding XRE family transcriptional regulator
MENQGLLINNDFPIMILKDSNEFAKVELKNNTLSWSNVEQFITDKNSKKAKVPFEIGADVLLKYSSTEVTGIASKIGRLVRDTRIKSGLTQKELAIKSGTSRNYISRIENDRSDIELDTLRKIIETGLGKHLEINVK